MKPERFNDPKWYGAPAWWIPIRKGYLAWTLGLTGLVAVAAIISGLSG